MKTILRAKLLVAALLATSLFASAQSNGNGNGNGNGNPNSGPSKSCSIDNIGVEFVGAPSGTTSTCNATVNLYFVAKLAGQEQKFVTFHIWNKANYPVTPYLQEGQKPNKNDFKGALATVELQRDQSANSWKIASITGPDGKEIQIAGVKLIAMEAPEGFLGNREDFRDYVYFQVRGLNLSVPAPCTALDINQFIVDVWGSWTGNNKTVSCLNTNVPILQCDGQGEPQGFGIIDCGNPRGYSVTFTNVGNCRPFFIDYKVYLDVNGNGVRDASDRQINDKDYDGDGIYDNVAILFPNKNLTTKLRPVPGLNTNMLFVEGELITAGANGEVRTPLEPFEIDNSCNLTPVKFKTFNAVRNTQNVQQINLTWETAMEQNNKGFHVQRKTDGEWKTIAFVFSAADGGNSTEAIRYRYNDYNNFRGVSQYRLLQEDLNGTAAYSDIKTIRGLEQAASVIVYPNPAANGVVNLLFADAGTRDVIVSDMSGRMVKQYREVANNSLTIVGLTGGFYTIKITDRKTASVSVEKVVVK